VSPLRGENPQNRPLSKLNNRHFALRAMLPVKNSRVTQLIILGRKSRKSSVFNSVVALRRAAIATR